MQANGPVNSRVVLITLVLWIVPMLMFPHMFGTELARDTMIHLGYEFVFYGLVAGIFFRRNTLIGVVQAAVACLVYRIAVGAVFGLLVAVMYSMNITVTMTLGIFSYLPALLLHIVATPFALSSVLSSRQSSELRRRSSYRPSTSNPVSTASHTSIAISKEKGIVKETATSRTAQTFEASRPPIVEPESSLSPLQHSEVTGFERATRYLGEHAGVFLAVVVDNEGLLLSNFKRGTLNPEDWAPLALLFHDANRRILDRTRLGTPDRLDLTLKDKRILIARDSVCTLMVLAERHADDTLSIRATQAMEMIRKYVTDRFGQKQDTNAERIHVSST